MAERGRPESRNAKSGCARSAKREMGPALRLTPLSPAVGFRRSALRLASGCQLKRPLRELELASLSPGARAGAGSVGGRDRSRGPVPCRPAVPRPYLVGLDLIAASALPEGSTKSSAPGRQIRPSDFAPSRSQQSGIWSAPGRTFERSAFLSSSARLSPSRRSGSKIPSSSPAFRPLSPKSQSPFR